MDKLDAVLFNPATDIIHKKYARPFIHTIYTVLKEVTSPKFMVARGIAHDIAYGIVQNGTGYERLGITSLFMETTKYEKLPQTVAYMRNARARLDSVKAKNEGFYKLIIQELKQFGHPLGDTDYFVS